MGGGGGGHSLDGSECVRARGDGKVQLLDRASERGLHTQQECEVNNGKRKKEIPTGSSRPHAKALNAKPRNLHFVLSMENH